MDGLRFCKMHGAGNDFVVLDATVRTIALTRQQIGRIADRHRGVGFDQLLLVRRLDDPQVPYAYDIFNTDGSAARQCGNGARCVVAWLIAVHGLQLPAVLQSPSGPVRALRLPSGEVGVELGRPQWRSERTLHLEAAGHTLLLYPVGMGNPHLVLEVPAVAHAAVDAIGSALNADPRLPDGANVEFVQRLGDGGFKVRVFERGVGETLACGSGACAVAVVAIRESWTARRTVSVDMPGGRLWVDWPDDTAAVLLCGPTRHVFDGTLAADFFSEQVPAHE